MATLMTKKISFNSLKTMLFAAIFSVAILANPARAGMELQHVDGQVVDLDDFRGDGRWLLVMLWATTCHICEMQKPDISAFHEKHKDTDAHVLGIALDGMERLDEIKANMQHHKTSFPSLVGNIAIVASHYQHMTEESLRGTPTYLLFNPSGELVGNNPGPLSVEAIEKFMASRAG